MPNGTIRRAAPPAETGGRTRDAGSSVGETKGRAERNLAPLDFYVPEPPARPGEPPNFSWLPIPEAGALPRPGVGAPADETRAHASGLIRVLDDTGRARGPWDPRLDPETLRRALRTMLLIRAFDTRMFRAQRQGKTSFYMTCTGEEAIGVAQAMALDPSDMAFPTYRCQAFLITRGQPLLDMMNQVYSNAGDRLKGRQMPILYSARDVGFFSAAGNLATHFPEAVGWAMASAIKHDTRIAIGWVGEGATAEGDFHHALTFASVYHAPVILNVVNNQYAISTFQRIAGGENTTFAERAAGYGLPGLRVDGNDFLAVYAATRWAADRARMNLGATLIELLTYRVSAHSTSDDPSKYRPAEEAKSWPLGDPVTRLARHLVLLGEWSDARQEKLVAELEQKVREIQREAESYGTLGSGQHHSPATMFDDVFEEMPWHLKQQRREMGF